MAIGPTEITKLSVPGSETELSETRNATSTPAASAAGLSVHAGQVSGIDRHAHVHRRTGRAEDRHGERQDEIGRRLRAPPAGARQPASQAGWRARTGSRSPRHGPAASRAAKPPSFCPPSAIASTNPPASTTSSGGADHHDIMRQCADRLGPALAPSATASPKTPIGASISTQPTITIIAAASPSNTSLSCRRGASAMRVAASANSETNSTSGSIAPGCGSGEDIVRHHRRQDLGKARDLARVGRAPPLSAAAALSRDRRKLEQAGHQQRRHRAADQQHRHEQRRPRAAPALRRWPPPASARCR